MKIVDFSRSITPLKIRLLQYYEVLWIHNLDAIWMARRIFGNINMDEIVYHIQKMTPHRRSFSKIVQALHNICITASWFFIGHFVNYDLIFSCVNFSPCCFTIQAFYKTPTYF